MLKRRWQRSPCHGGKEGRVGVCGPALQITRVLYSQIELLGTGEKKRRTKVTVNQMLVYVNAVQAIDIDHSIDNTPAMFAGYLPRSSQQEEESGVAATPLIRKKKALSRLSRVMFRLPFMRTAVNTPICVAQRR